MKPFLVAIALLASTAPAYADPLSCDLKQYTSQQGLAAAVQQDSLLITWAGERGTSLRLRLGIDAGRPLIREMGIQRSGPWAVLGRNLAPDFEVTTGKRRANNEWGQLRQLKKDTPEE